MMLFRWEEMDKKLNDSVKQTNFVNNILYDTSRTQFLQILWNLDGRPKKEIFLFILVLKLIGNVTDNIGVVVSWKCTRTSTYDRQYRWSLTSILCQRPTFQQSIVTSHSRKTLLALTPMIDFAISP